MIRVLIFLGIVIVAPIVAAFGQSGRPEMSLQITQRGYYEAPGVNIMMFDDYYPEGHQGGLTILLRGTRVAANGDIRLEPTPGQWSPAPVVGNRSIDRDKGTMAVDLWYPDSSKDRKGFNPIEYPPLHFRYTITTEAVAGSIRLRVDLEKPLPVDWTDKVGFNLEIFPGLYFGEYYLMDGNSGVFPRQAGGPLSTDAENHVQIAPMATGQQLVIAPGISGKEMRISSTTNHLQMYDERGLHNNGWFVIRSTVAPGATRRAIEWMITPTPTPGWRSTPSIQVSQVGYHPKQKKFAMIELDRNIGVYEPVRLVHILEDHETVTKSDLQPQPWGEFLRYRYLRFDFSDIAEPGLYKIRYGTMESQTFEIKSDVFARFVWQPTLEYFLPVQMCHMKIIDRYKVWHGLCHMDDALVPPVNYNHFDGYFQRESTLMKYQSGDHVPGLNIGGWHDAGDYDLRIESQTQTIYKLALAYELFGEKYDATTINQTTRIAELHRPDGVPDLLQQMEHGVLSLVGAYASMGRMYRGIICPTLRQYVLLGDGQNETDGFVYDPNGTDPYVHQPLPKDDRLVFTEVNPRHDLYTARALAAASRVLRPSNPALAAQCLTIAEDLYAQNKGATSFERLNAEAELYITTLLTVYRDDLLSNVKLLCSNVERGAEVIGRLNKALNDAGFSRNVEEAVKATAVRVAKEQEENPYGVPYHPNIWGAGWEIQRTGVDHLFLHMAFPTLFPAEYAFNALTFVLGCHPGENSASFVSGVGAKSLTTAYGVNRDDWSYIPGGICSGTALIRPDLPELKVWPYFWQQTEYVLGGGTMDYVLLALAADHLFNAR